MPLTRISVPDHLSPALARALADAVHNALVTTCQVPVDDRFQLISRFAPINMIVDPHFPNVARSPSASIVEITFLLGRSAEQKRALYKHLVAQAVASGFRADDIMISLTENASIDWSLGRGEAYSGHQTA